MGTVHHVNDATFGAAIPADGTVVVDLSASWCGPCHAYAPIVEASAQRHPDVTHLAVDVDESPELAQRFDVLGVPTTVFLRDGIVVGAFPGVLPASRLDDLIEQTMNLNMDDVRASLNKRH